MNKKAQGISLQLVFFILAGIILFFAAYEFVPDTIDTAKEFFEGLGFGFEEQTVPNQVIDEERIDEGTKISFSALSYDSQSGQMYIIKNIFGKGWSLYKINYGGLEYETVVGTRGIEKEETLLEQQQTLSALLTSDNVRGTLLIGDTFYIHSSYAYEGWFQETEEGDRRYQTGEEIPVEDLTNIILADLYTQATEE